MRKDWLLALLFGALLTLAASGLYHPGTQEDDSLYLSASRGLAQGYGFVDMHDPARLPHGFYPPGYPAVLAVLFLIFGPNLWPARLLTLACALGGLALARRALAGAPHLTWTVLLCAVNCYWVYTSAFVMSDFPFVLLAWLGVGLFPLEKAPLWRWALLGALVAVGLYLRLSAAGWGVGLGLAMLVRRVGVAPVLTYGGVAAVLFLPNLLRSQGVEHYSDVGGFERLSVLLQNLSYYSRALPLWLWGEPEPLTDWALQGQWALNLLALATVLVTLRGFVLLGRQLPRVRVALLIVLVTTVQQLNWPYQDVRFFLPWLPVFVVAALAGAGRWGRFLGGAMLVSQLAWVGWLVQGAWRFPNPPNPAYAWLAQQAAPGDVLASGKIESWLYTGRPTIYLPDDLSRTTPVLRRLYESKVRWVVANRGGQYGEAQRAFADSLPHHLRKVHEVRREVFNSRYFNEPATVTVYQVVGDREAFLQAVAAFEKGCALLDAGQPGEAQRSFAECLARTPDVDFPYARYLLGVTLQQQGQTAAARAAFEEVLRLFPGHPQAAQALQALPR